MLKTIGTNALLALLLTIPLVIWANPLPASAVTLIYVLSFSIVSLVAQLFKKRKRSRTNSTTLPIAIISLSVFLEGCASVPPPGQSIAKAFATVESDTVTVASDTTSKEKVKQMINFYKLECPAPLRTERVAHAHVVARDYLNELTKPNCQYGAYGYILLTRPYPNDSVDYKRIKLIAEMFKTVYESSQSYLRVGVEPADMMIMYWLLKGDRPVREDISVDQMIENYDYAKAHSILASLSKTGKKGPVFVAWNKPYVSGIYNKKEALVFDITGFDEDDIKRAFNTWDERVSNDPSSWRNGFEMEQLRSAFRNFLNAHSECLLKIFVSVSDR
jgi:hypothetical protein